MFFQRHRVLDLNVPLLALLILPGYREKDDYHSWFYVNFTQVKIIGEARTSIEKMSQQD